jgi:hypothetical protein
MAAKDGAPRVGLHPLSQTSDPSGKSSPKLRIGSTHRFDIPRLTGRAPPVSVARVNLLRRPK